MRMPPSVDSESRRTPGVTRSSPRKRNLCSPKVNLTEDVRKKSRRSSSLSETSLRSSGEDLDGLGQVTQESQPRSQQRRSSPDIVAHILVDLPPGRRQEEYVSSAQKNDGFLKRARFGKEGNRASEDVDDDVDRCIGSMILRSGCLARSILAAYDKEKDQVNREQAGIITELAQLRKSNEAAAAELANLQLENTNLANKEASTSSKLEELCRQCAMRDAINIVCALIMSKAQMLQNVAELKRTASTDIDQLKFENAQMSKAITEIEEQGRLKILNLSLSLEAANKELTKLSSEKAELVPKDRLDREAAERSKTCELIRCLTAVREEVNLVHSKIEALLREKDDAAARAADAAAVELDKMKSRNDTLSREMQAALQMTAAEMEKMHSTIESTTGNLSKLLLEKEEISREKAQSESLRKMEMEIAQLLSDKAALVAEKEHTSARVAHEFRARFRELSSRFEGAVEELQVVRNETGLEKARLQSEMALKNSELERLRKALFELQVDMASKEASGAAEIQRLMKEKEDCHAREIALLEKLQSLVQSMKVSPRECSDMHLAFLMNWGLSRAGAEYSFN